MSIRTTVPTVAAALRAGLPCLVTVLACSGCYRNVVGATGPGSERYNVQEANIKEGESVWSEPKAQPRDVDRYSGTELDRAKSAPQPQPKRPGQQTNGNG
jgi:hypothetical protein